MRNFMSAVEQYLPLVIAGVHAANTVPHATNADKKAVVLSTVTGISDAVTAVSVDPKVQAVGMIIDIAASVINALMKKTAPATPAT